MEPEGSLRECHIFFNQGNVCLIVFLSHYLNLPIVAVAAETQLHTMQVRPHQWVTHTGSVTIDMYVTICKDYKLSTYSQTEQLYPTRIYRLPAAHVGAACFFWEIADPHAWRISDLPEYPRCIPEPSPTSPGWTWHHLVSRPYVTSYSNQGR